MNIQTNKEGNDYTIKVTGDLDASSSLAFDESIISAVSNGERRLMVDFSGLDYISSAGLGVFVSHLEEFKKNNIKLVLFGLSSKVMNVFEILGIDKLLSIVSDQQHAKDLLNES